MRLHPQKIGKISDSKWKNSMSSSGLSLPPLTHILELVTLVNDCRLDLCELQASCWQCLGPDSSFGENTWRYRQHSITIVVALWALTGPAVR